MGVLVAREAPDFVAPAAMPDGSIKEDFKLSGLRGKHVILFFWPLDFTFVCPTEIIAMDHRYEGFDDLGVQIVGVSIDSQFTHCAWRKTPIENGGIGPVKFPIVADTRHSISQDYGVEHPEAGVAMRATFLIDKQGIVQHQTVNNLPLGRNIDEHLRMTEALQFVEEFGETVCPAGWNKGDPGMKQTAEGVAEYLSEHNSSL
ncbi:MAG: putative peroxiredoxin [Verrucomicrobia subdivision 3 bacterium]|nr:putative peroxiredoxin [Limisphaerales bacterium]MCS1414980.1 putative peroxiredoxin [Limisphaerales bacterium]